jgi:hypothetical protein
MLRRTCLRASVAFVCPQAGDIRAVDGSLEVCYDSTGVMYQLPRYIFSTPKNLVSAAEAVLPKRSGHRGTVVSIPVTMRLSASVRVLAGWFIGVVCVGGTCEHVCVCVRRVWGCRCVQHCLFWVSSRFLPLACGHTLTAISTKWIPTHQLQPLVLLVLPGLVVGPL